MSKKTSIPAMLTTASGNTQSSYVLGRAIVRTKGYKSNCLTWDEYILQTIVVNSCFASNCMLFVKSLLLSIYVFYILSNLVRANKSAREAGKSAGHPRGLF